MKNQIKFRLRNALIICVLIAFSSCKKDDQPAPLTGKLLAYTGIRKSAFDRIDVIVDGKVAAALTAPYLAKPTCGAQPSESVVSLPLAPGLHKIYAIQYKNGRKVGEWNEEEETIVADKCLYINWAD